MNTIEQHFPGCVDSDPKSAAFSSTKELLAVPFVAEFAKLPGFNRFSLNRSSLMAEMKNGSYWVVGYIADRTNVDLPEW